MIFDYRKCQFDQPVQKLCEYALKLTLTPQGMGRSDVDRLKDSGWNDAQITVAAQVIGYFNYINRIADGLGVDLESWMQKISESDWKANKPNWRALINA
ncbi:MAG: peroxidase [Planctomycetota bacterium]